MWKLVVVLGFGLVIGGCLEREEEITVHEDGSVEVAHEIVGDAGDRDGGAARLPDQPPFESQRFTRSSDDGEDKYVLTARARFSDVSEIPSHFRSPDDPLEDVGLRFTTQLIREESEAGTSYLFVRRYSPRTWARFGHWYELAFTDEAKALIDRGDDELSREERLKVIAAFVAFERGKNLEWTHEAISRLGLKPGEEVKARLASESAIELMFAAHLSPEQAEAISQLESSQVEAAVEDLQRRIDDAIEAALRVELGRAFDGVALAHELARAREGFNVTEDLHDEKFRVRLTLPGTVVASNGEPLQNNRIEWTFGGKNLRDREVVLVARSWVAK